LPSIGQSGFVSRIVAHSANQNVSALFCARNSVVAVRCAIASAGGAGHRKVRRARSGKTNLRHPSPSGEGDGIPQVARSSSVTTYSDQALCEACAQSRAMLDRVMLLSSKRPPKEFELIETLPLLLEMVLSLWRKEFDFESQTHTKTAGIMIILAVATERAKVLAAMRARRASRRRA
jgi:hypothetical protein